MSEPRLAEEQALELAEIFRMLGDPNRLRIAVVCLVEPRCIIRDMVGHVADVRDIAEPEAEERKTGRC
ncbi:hypothetical protein [Thalassobaculum sp.]|uniref:hypothetical protein n=1 Tax=Thalassobaculum sp. TaxID=2022740 RepID=UPI0032EDFB27